MKAGMVALILWLLFCAANVFAVVNPPFPKKPEPPDQIAISIDDQIGPPVDNSRTTQASLRIPKK
jgi:hypothetical protein